MGGSVPEGSASRERRCCLRYAGSFLLLLALVAPGSLAEAPGWTLDRPVLDDLGWSDLEAESIVVAGAADGAWAIDQRAQKLVVLGPEGAVTRSFPLPALPLDGRRRLQEGAWRGPIDIAGGHSEGAASPGGLLLNTPADPDHPLALVDMAGKLVRRFGETRPARPPWRQPSSTTSSR